MCGAPGRRRPVEPLSASRPPAWAPRGETEGEGPGAPRRIGREPRHRDAELLCDNDRGRVLANSHDQQLRPEVGEVELELLGAIRRVERAAVAPVAMQRKAVAISGPLSSNSATRSPGLIPCAARDAWVSESKPRNLSKESGRPRGGDGGGARRAGFQQLANDRHPSPLSLHRVFCQQVGTGIHCIDVRGRRIGEFA